MQNDIKRYMLCREVCTPIMKQVFVLNRAPVHISAIIPIFTLVLFFCVVPVSFLYAQSYDRELQKINTSYSLRYLQKADEFYTSNRYADALACIEKGLSFDDSFADFFYLKAQCLLKLKEHRAQCLKAAETAITSGLRVHLYRKEDFILLLARLYTETKRYAEALELLNTLTFDCADRDFYRASAFYNLGDDGRAQEIIEQALNRWSFDSRFPLLFFLQERNKPISNAGKKLAASLLQRLYVWTDKTPWLAVYAAPFEPNHEENRRRLQAYRAMYGVRKDTVDARTALAAILAELRYGVIDEDTAVTDFFNVRTAVPFIQQKTLPAFYSDQLAQLCRLIGTHEVREKIGDRLNAFNGIVLEDNNDDSIIDSAVFFEQGRPLSAFFDINQDDEYEYKVQCHFGTPYHIVTPKNDCTVQYDSYPAVHSIIYQAEKREYTMQPLAFRWEPIIQRELDLGLRDTDADSPSFFTLSLHGNASILQKHDFIFSVLYSEEPSLLDEYAVRHTQFAEGKVLSVEIKNGTQLLARERYRNGIIAQKEYDYDKDGFFETQEHYNTQGRLESISVDNNKNKAFEYYEVYQADGTVIKNWDENEDGVPEIQYTQFASGDAQTMWKHRYSGLPVALYYKKGKPEKLTIGTKNVPLIKDTVQNIYYLDVRPALSDKAVEMLAQRLKDKLPALTAYTLTIGRYELYAVRSEGAIFVQVYAASSAAEERR